MTVLVLDVEAAVRLLLVADAGLTALVDDRIHADQLPQNEVLPAVVYQEISRIRDVGASHDGPGLHTVRVQVDAYSAQRYAALEVAEAIVAALCPRRAPGQVGFSRTVDVDGVKVEVQAVRPAGGSSGVEPETKLFRRRRDFIVTAAEAA